MSFMMAQPDVMKVTDDTFGLAGHTHVDGLAHKKSAV